MLIRTMRRERGWTQEQLALILGINVRTVQRLERGGVPSLETAQALASAFGCEARLFQARDTTAQIQVKSSAPAPAARPTPDSAPPHAGRRSLALYAAAFLLVGGGVTAILILALLIAGPSSPGFIATLIGSGVCVTIGVGAAWPPRHA